MTVIAYRFRAYPNSGQEKLFARHFGCKRKVFNLYLEEAHRIFLKTGSILSAYAFIKKLPALKRSPELKYLAEVNSQSLQSAVLNAAESFERFANDQKLFAEGRWKRSKPPKDKPNYKSKRDGWQSFQCPQHVSVRFGEGRFGRIKLPKVGEVRCALHRRFDESLWTIKTVTVTKEPSGKYYITVLTENKKAVLPMKTTVREEEASGADVGIEHAFVMRTPTKTVVVENPRHLEKHLESLAVKQKILARKEVTFTEVTLPSGRTVKQKLPSKGYSKQQKLIAEEHEDIRHARRNFLEVTTTRVADDKQATTLVVETLNLKGIFRNHHLARALADVGIGMLFRMLEYKVDRRGKNLLRADRWYPSSKRCPVCGKVNADLKLKDRRWVCPHCGAEHASRDETAAINLRRYPFLSQEEKVLLARKDVGKAEQAADPLRAVSQETDSKTELRREPGTDDNQASAFEGSREGCFNRATGKTETSPKGLQHTAAVGSQEASSF